MKKLTLPIILLGITGLLAGCPKNTVALNPITKGDASLLRKITANFQLRESLSQPLVHQEMAYFQKHKEYLTLLSKNAKPYLYYVYQETQRRHMPAEIALLPMVESNYQPYGVSVTGATGLWQMMPGTASGFGIRINWWYDGRRDVKASTSAALNYLSYLHNRFGNWLLAIAAYDSGEGTVAQAIRFNRKHGKSTDYWSLPLPKETRFYIPKLLALSTLIRYPNTYHIKLEKIPNQPYFKSVIMHGQINLQHVASLSHTSLDTVRQLNPGFRRWATEPKKTYTLLLPTSKVITYLANLSQHKAHLITWVHHKVQPGESLYSIAANYHTRPTIIKNANQLHSHVLHPKQTLLVPTAYNKLHHKLLIKKTSKIISEDRIPGPKRIEHIVTHNETLWTISSRYHVKPSQIRYWNNLAYHSSLHIKQPLIIWVTHHTPHTTFYSYKVKKGDTLIAIAQRFNTKTSTIRRVNHLRGNLIRIGLELNIPKLSGQYAALKANSQKLG
jgi:membrane-bound lytic murein transglycosylase D